MQKANYQKREEEIKKALDELRAGKFYSIKACADAHGISPSTLSNRRRGGRDRITAHQGAQALTPAEEDTLSDCILRLCRLGKPPRNGVIRDMAIAIITARDQPFFLNITELSENGAPKTLAYVAEDWPVHFLARHTATREERSRAMKKDRLGGNKKENNEARLRRLLERIIENPILLPSVREQLVETSENALTQIALLERENAALRESASLWKQLAGHENGPIGGLGVEPVNWPS